MERFTIERVSDEVLAALQSNQRKGVKQYPFGEMKVGDSFVVEQGKDVGRAKNAMRTYAHRTPRKFAAIREGETHWRIVRIA